MQKLFKTISKQTGNICFALSREEGEYLFYASRNRNLSYAPVARLVEGLCFQKTDTNEYFLSTHGDSWITQFDGTTANESYLDVSPYLLREIINGKPNEFFAFDVSGNRLVKFTCDFVSPSFVLNWEVSLSGFDFTHTNIVYRDSDRSIIISDNGSVIVFRDDISSASLIATTSIPGNSNLYLCKHNEYTSRSSYLRWRQVTGEELEQTSSSSMSSLSSDSSSSSSSFGHSTSSSSSSSLIYSSSSPSSESSSSYGEIARCNISITTDENGPITQTYTWVPDLATASAFWWQNVPAYLTDDPAEDRAIYYNSGLGLWVLQDVNNGLVVEAALGEFDDIVGTEASWGDPGMQPHIPPNFVTSITCI